VGGIWLLSWFVKSLIIILLWSDFSTIYGIKWLIINWTCFDLMTYHSNKHIYFCVFFIFSSFVNVLSNDKGL